MISEVVKVSIDGVPQEQLVPDLVEVEVDENVDQADVFALRVALAAGADGSCTYVDDDRFGLWKRLTVEAGYPGATQTVMDGYVTHVDVGFPVHGEPYLEVSGMDASAVMDLEDKQLAWPNKTDHEIAHAVFGAYGLHAEVEDTATRHAERVSTVLQTETDIRFLCRLASRHGFECRVAGSTGFFRSPNYRDAPQRTLVAGFGAQTNLADLTVRLDGTPASRAEIRRVDPVEKRLDVKASTGTGRRKLGQQQLDGLRGRVPAGRALVRRQVPHSVPEMEARLRAATEPADRFLTVEGEVDSRAYRTVLRAGRLVTVAGIGKNYSGLYYVCQVRHLFTAEAYVQRFVAYRNGLGLTGQERFTPAGAAPGGTDRP